MEFQSIFKPKLKPRYQNLSIELGPCVLGSLASVMYVRKVDLVVFMKGYVSASHILYRTCRLPYLG